MTRTILPGIGFVLLSALLLAGCTSPPAAATAGANGASDAAATGRGETPPVRRVPSMGGPLPAERVPSPVMLDIACNVDADCAAKDIGSCCGARPACVHKDSATDPAAVQAECARRGIASTCGSREVRACACEDGRCRDASRTGVVR